MILSLPLILFLLTPQPDFQIDHLPLREWEQVDDSLLDTI